LKILSKEGNNVAQWRKKYRWKLSSKNSSNRIFKSWSAVCSFWESKPWAKPETKVQQKWENLTSAMIFEPIQISYSASNSNSKTYPTIHGMSIIVLKVLKKGFETTVWEKFWFLF
jgi:hypothetical protein